MNLIRDNISTTGKVLISVYDENNNIIDTRYISNLVVTTGKNHFASRIVGTPSTGEGSIISHMAIGTGTSIPISSDTSLQSQLSTKVAITSLTHITGTSIIQVTASFTGYVGNITEAGIFNNSTSGTMICRTTFGTVSLISGQTMAITWSISIN